MLLSPLYRGLDWIPTSDVYSGSTVALSGYPYETLKAAQPIADKLIADFKDKTERSAGTLAVADLAVAVIASLWLLVGP